MTQSRVGRIRVQRERETVGRSRADQWRSADLHGTNGLRGFGHTAERDDSPLAGQTGLIDDLDGAVCKRCTQRPDIGRCHDSLATRSHVLYLRIWMILLKSSVQSRKSSRGSTCVATSAICGTWSDASRSDSSIQSVRLAIG